MDNWYGLIDSTKFKKDMKKLKQTTVNGIDYGSQVGQSKVDKDTLKTIRLLHF